MSCLHVARSWKRAHGSWGKTQSSRPPGKGAAATTATFESRTTPATGGTPSLIRPRNGRGGRRGNEKTHNKNGSDILLNKPQQSTSHLRHCSSSPHPTPPFPTPYLYYIAVAATAARFVPLKGKSARRSAFRGASRPYLAKIYWVQCRGRQQRKKVKNCGLLASWPPHPSPPHPSPLLPWGGGSGGGGASCSSQKQICLQACLLGCGKASLGLTNNVLVYSQGVNSRVSQHHCCPFKSGASSPSPRRGGTPCRRASG